MRLSAGRRMSRAAEEEEGGSVGGQDPDGDKGRGVSLGMAGNSDGWGPDDRASDTPPSCFGKGGSLLPPPVDRRRPVDGNGSKGGDNKWIGLEYSSYE